MAEDPFVTYLVSPAHRARHPDRCWGWVDFTDGSTPQCGRLATKVADLYPSIGHGSGSLRQLDVQLCEAHASRRNIINVRPLKEHA